jgi:glycosyltransferase involved in cell wall biosynthesis
MLPVSIILPVKNGNPYIFSAIQSALDQTLSNFELIVSENFSTDNTANTIESFTDSRIVVIRPSQPLSLVENWNFALSHAQGEFVIVLGADDVLLPDHLEKRLAWHRKNPEVYISSGSFNYINSNSEITSCVRPHFSELTEAPVILDALFRGNPLNIMTVFFRRSYNGVSWNFPNEPMFPDWKLWMQIIATTGSCGFLQEASVLYRVHSESGTNRINKYNWSYRAASIVCEFIDEFTDQLIRYNLNLESIKREATRGLWLSAQSAFRQGDITMSGKIINLYFQHNNYRDFFLSFSSFLFGKIYKKSS